MFIKNVSGGIVNAAHIITVGIEPPKFEQCDFIVAASLTHGTTILYRGSEKKCETYINNLAAILNAAPNA